MNRREVKSAARHALAAAGYRKSGRGEVFTAPLRDGVLAWVGLMTDPADDGVLETSPKVGVRHERLHRMADAAAGRRGGTRPTVSTLLGYLMPARTSNLVWRFDDPQLLEPQAEDMVGAIATFGGPYMEEHAGLPEVLAALRESVPWEYSQELIPAAYVCLGDPAAAEAFLDEELNKQQGRDDPAAANFREFAKRFRIQLRDEHR
jgi:hypothetical protein